MKKFIGKLFAIDKILQFTYVCKNDIKKLFDINGLERRIVLLDKECFCGVKK